MDRFSGKIKILALACLVIGLAIFIRFYNFPSRINFGPEQAMSLIVTGEYLNEKVTLLGVPSTQRITSEGHIIFSSPFFNYSLMPLEKFFNYDPIPITGYFTLLNIFTGLVTFLILSKISNRRVAFFSLILFIFNEYMIFHSLFIWIVNYLPLIGILTFYFLWEFKDKNKPKYPLLLGLLSGIAFGLEYMYFLTAVLVLIVLASFSKNKLRDVLLFLIGFAVANFPIILFDVKHNLYYLRTFLQYFEDTIKNPGQSRLAYYQFLQFWPILAFLGGLIIDLFYSRFAKFRNICSRLLGYMVIVAFVVLYVIFNLTSKKVSFVNAVGMSAGFNIIKLDVAARVISLDCPKDNFNVAMLLDFDSRAHPLRYLLNYRYRLKPKGIEQYSDIDTLYVIASSNYNFGEALAWEVKTFAPFKVHILKEIDQNYFVYKLVKN